MRDLALVTFRIVDENSRIYPEDALAMFTDLGPLDAKANMTKLDRNATPDPWDIIQTSDGDEQYIPKHKLNTIQLEPCNLDSALGFCYMNDLTDIVRGCIGKLIHAGQRLLSEENERRKSVDRMSRTLFGDGVEQVNEVKFYAVFNTCVEHDGTEVWVEFDGVLCMQKLGLAMYEEIPSGGN